MYSSALSGPAALSPSALRPMACAVLRMSSTAVAEFLARANTAAPAPAATPPTTARPLPSPAANLPIFPRVFFATSTRWAILSAPLAMERMAPLAPFLTANLVKTVKLLVPATCRLHCAGYRAFLFFNHAGMAGEPSLKAVDRPLFGVETEATGDSPEHVLDVVS